MVAHDLGALDAEIVEDGGDPLRNTGHAGTGHAAAGGINVFHPRLRINLVEHGAQIGFGHFGAYAQSLDGSALPTAQNFPVGDNCGPSVGAAAVNS